MLYTLVWGILGLQLFQGVLLYRSLYELVQSTGEDWNLLMKDAYDTENNGSAAPLFMSYVVISKFIVLKMAIALINENTAWYRSSRTCCRLKIEQFTNVWSTFDGTGRR